MPATSPEAKARKAKRHEERRKERGLTREARRKATPEKRLETNRKRNAKRKASLAKNPAAKAVYHVKRWQRRKVTQQEKRNARPFVGCDGEGAKDAVGRSRYVLFRMGDRELHRHGERLTTPELLQFIVDHPDPEAILVGFFFEYDISNILFDVPSRRDKADQPSRLERLLQVDLNAAAGAANPYTGGWTDLRFPDYPVFGVQYVPRNFLKVSLRQWGYDPQAERWHMVTVPGSTRTIYDTQGFFQCSFLKALELWEIGSEHHAAIARMKADRSIFAGLTDEIRRYCEIECGLLARMMEAFREQCIATGMVPQTWNGAGKIASALLKEHGAMPAARLAAVTPPGVIELAHAAYYGGRFETTRVGRLPPVSEHDINSAYPAGMLKLPCLEHGTWIEQTGKQLAKLAQAQDGRDGLSGELFVARVRFSHPPDQFLCGLPFRSKTGRLSWPREGNGVYWSCEIRSAERLGATIEYKGGWRFVAQCDCVSHGFVADLYEQRLAIGKSVRGIPIKLGLNSIYGKKAQRIGKPTFANPIEAGLITALTRAKINDAIVAAGDPRRVVMIATDGIYSVDGPIELDRGNRLGQWEVKQFPSLFIVRPGLYWPPDRKGNVRGKTRGLSPKFFEPLIPKFEQAWDDWLATPSLLPCFDKRSALPDPTTVPVVPVPIETFVGVRLALRLNDPAQACQWIKRDVQVRYSWVDKRAGVKRLGDALMLGALSGDPEAHSHHYDPGAVLQTSAAFELDRMLIEALPDYLEIGPPRTDQTLPDDLA